MGLVANDFHVVLAGGNIPVEIGGRDFQNFIVLESAGGFPYNGKRFG
jgi:hypothetical protein